MASDRSRPHADGNHPDADVLAGAAAGTLDEHEQRAVDQHLTGCLRCAAELAEWRRFGEAARQAETVDGSVGPRRAAIARLQQRLEQRRGREPRSGPGSGPLGEDSR